MNEGSFLQDLAVIMTVAGVTSVLFNRFGWPKVIGYIFAGILVSRHTWGGSFLVDEASVSTIGTLGIVFLMFTLGLEFDAAGMRKTGRVSIPTALLDASVMIWLGYTVGTRVFGWSSVASLFLGAAICDSATTLLAKTIDEMKWRGRPFVRYVFGTTICEDILCVGVLALVMGVAQGKGMDFAAVGMSVGGLAVFFTGVIVFGLVIVPRLLDAVGRMQDDETLLLTLLGCCFFVTYIAFTLDFSYALGAFLVGVVGASAGVRSRILRLVAPLRSMFAAVFFVSIGLLVDPAECWRRLPAIILLSLLVVAGKGFNCFSMSMLAGQGVKDSVQTGFGLAQIGEFAYMVALLYVGRTGDAKNGMYQMVVGASLITTCLNPVLLRASDPAGEWLENHLPAKLRGWHAAYRDWLERYRKAKIPSVLQRRIRGRLAWLFLIVALNAAVAISAEMLGKMDWTRFSAFFETHKLAFFCLVANFFFLLTLTLVAPIAQRLGRDIAAVLLGGGGRKRWTDAVQGFVGLVVRTAMLALAFGQVVLMNVNLLPAEPLARAAVIAALAAAAVFGWKRFGKAGRAAGLRFNRALAAEKRKAPSGKETVLSVPDDFYARMTLDLASPFAGRTIRELDIRARTGASIVSVMREGRLVRNPGPDWRFAVGDTVNAIGDGAQLASLRNLSEGKKTK